MIAWKRNRGRTDGNEGLKAIVSEHSANEEKKVKQRDNRTKLQK